MARHNWILAVLAIAVLGGCNQGLVKHKVSGAVELDGVLIADGDMTFRPTDPALPPEGARIIGGKYTVDIASGSYKVEFHATKKVPLLPGEESGAPDAKEKVVSIIPPHYESDRPPAEVKGPGEIHFKLSSKK
jgi:hypothetical protein